MDIKRRDFFKISGSGAVVLASAGEGAAAEPVDAEAGKLSIEGAQATTTICPYCAVGCGLLVYSRDGKVVHAEGDPDNPINEGALCPKGAALPQMVDNPLRLAHPLYRAAGAEDWREVTWDWALDEIASRVKTARDATFVEKNADGKVVNRTEGIASVGSAALDNEECYLLQKWLRSLGLVAIEHQARI